jgi:GT2 family glycosyltransferase
LIAIEPREDMGALATTNRADTLTALSVPAASDISVIIPVYNGELTLRRSLEPLLAMRTRGEIAEIIVVDDRSTDASVGVALAMGVQAMDSGGRLGPGGARNVAAQQAVGGVLWFVDADVIVHADAARVLASALQRTGATAVFGTYDDRPSAEGFLSQYKNLVHAYYHRREEGAADTFWAGCGAIRKQAFLDVGGFDSARYPYPSVEDIELGWRLRQRELSIQIVPALQATHLKVWRLKGLLHTEIFRRAIPWSRLIHAGGAGSQTLNLGSGERLRALLIVFCLGSIVPAAAGWAPRWLPAAMLGAVAIANGRLFEFFRRRRGAIFAMGAVAFHQVYYLYSASAFAWCWIEHRASALRGTFRRRAPSS